MLSLVQIAQGIFTTIIDSATFRVYYDQPVSKSARIKRVTNGALRRWRKENAGPHRERQC
jgi:hypothetical protein